MSMNRFLGGSLLAIVSRALRARWFRSMPALLILGVLLAGVLTVGEGQALGQASSWQFSPYEIRVVIAMEPGVFPDAVRDQIARTLQQRARVVAGVTWDLTISPPPTPSLATDMYYQLDELTPQQVEEQLLLRSEAEASQDQAIDWGSILSTRDKLMLVSLRSGRQGYLVEARELCSHTRQMGPTIRREAYQREYLPEVTFGAIVDAFLPIVRITDNERKVATATLRAGGLIVEEGSPSGLAPGSVLYPVIRRNDRVGNPAENGIRVMDWTYMQVTDRTDAEVECVIHSGYRAPLGGRSSRRVDKYGLQVKVHSDTTVLHVQTRGDSPRPLAGHEIFAQDPDTEESERIGLTDWRGQIVIGRPADKPITLLYVKNGGTLLARLPMVPGYLPEMTAEMVDDEGRLEAEAFVRGMQGRMMDLVARREFLSSMIRRKIQESKLDEAQQLLGQFRDLPSFSELDAILDRKKSDVRSSDRRTQANIDQLFSKTHELLVKYLDPKQATQLELEINRASSGG